MRQGSAVVCLAERATPRLPLGFNFTLTRVVLLVRGVKVSTAPVPSGGGALGGAPRVAHGASSPKRT
jgi:hypothetical protein